MAELELEHLIKRAENLLERCDKLSVHGVSKLKKKCQAELNFLTKIRAAPLKVNQLKCSNLSHLQGVIEAAETLPGVTHILQPFHLKVKGQRSKVSDSKAQAKKKDSSDSEVYYPVPRGDPTDNIKNCSWTEDHVGVKVTPKVKASLVVDVVCNHGNKWVKVVARKAQALHQTWMGDGQFGDKNIVDQARDYVYYAQHNPVNYIPPTVLFVFHRGISDSIATELEHKLAVEVLGDIEPAAHYESGEECIDTCTSRPAGALSHVQDGKCVGGLLPILDEHESVRIGVDKEYGFQSLICEDGEVPAVSRKLDQKLRATVSETMHSVPECFSVISNTLDPISSEISCIEGCLACRNHVKYVSGSIFACTCVICRNFHESQQYVAEDCPDVSDQNPDCDIDHNRQYHLTQSQDCQDAIGQHSECDIDNNHQSHQVQSQSYQCRMNESTMLSYPAEHKLNSKPNYDKNSLSQPTQSDCMSPLTHLQPTAQVLSPTCSPTIRRVNLDVTAMVALVSALTHGRSDWVYRESVLTAQAEEERMEPALPLMYQCITGKTLVACQTAVTDFQNIVNTLGGPAETRRARQLMEQLHVVPDCPPPHVVSMTCSGNVKHRAKIIFGSGETLLALTLSANMGFIRAADNQGVTFATLIHASRALTEEKEKTGSPLKTS